MSHQPNYDNPSEKENPGRIVSSTHPRRDGRTDQYDNAFLVELSERRRKYPWQRTEEAMQ